MSAKINDLETKLYEVKCETCREPDRSTLAQPDESLDQTHKVESEEDNPASPQEAELPLLREGEPHPLILVEPKTTLVFIEYFKRSTTHKELHEYFTKQT